MVVNFTGNGIKITLSVLVCSLLSICFSPAAKAQTVHQSQASIKAETRKSKRDAARFEADYKESHLNTANYTLKKGKAGRKKVRVYETPADYLYDNEINQIEAEPPKLSKNKKLPKSKTTKK